MKDSRQTRSSANDVIDKSALLLQAEAVKGKCFVICFNPKHNLYNISFASMTLRLTDIA